MAYLPVPELNVRSAWAALLAPFDRLMDFLIELVAIDPMCKSWFFASARDNKLSDSISSVSMIWRIESKCERHCIAWLGNDFEEILTLALDVVSRIGGRTWIDARIKTVNILADVEVFRLLGMKTWKPISHCCRFNVGIVNVSQRFP